jgi:hypothetical protein
MRSQASPANAGQYFQCGIRALNVRSNQSVDEVFTTFADKLVKRADIGFQVESNLKESLSR